MKPFDAFVVVDADSEVSSNFLTAIAVRFEGGADAAQCRYIVRNSGDSIRTRLMNVALFGFNVLRPRGRDRLGLSAGIYGNGFALSAATLRAVPYTAASVVEDLEYHLALIRARRRVQFIDTAAVYGDMPVAGTGVKTQRARWEGGRLRMMVEKVPGLARDVLRGRFRSVEPALDLLLLPLAFHVVLLAVRAARADGRHSGGRTRRPGHRGAASDRRHRGRRRQLPKTSRCWRSRPSTFSGKFC